MQLLKRIGLYGISGVGKTTILSTFTKLPSNTIWLEGTKMVLDAAQMTLDNFKKLPEIEKYYFREMAISNAFEIQIQKQQHIIIDGHLAFPKGEDGFDNVMTDNDKKFYTDFLYLKLPPQIILTRQQNDAIRKRNYSLTTIANWIDFELIQLKKTCLEHNINLCIIESEDLETSVNIILKTINDV